MKSLKKKRSKRTVEAYDCYCKDPMNCLNQCYEFDSMQGGVATIADVIQYTRV